MLTHLLRLLAPLAPRRHPRSFPILRTGRFPTGLFRSRRHPTPAPRPRPLQHRQSTPTQPQPHSPTRPKNPAQAISRRPAPSGGGPARDSSPFTPPKSDHSQPPPAPPLRTPSPRPPPTTPPLTLESVVSAPPNRTPNPAKNHPAAPQEFFGKNSYAHEPATSLVPNRPARRPGSPHDLADRPTAHASHAAGHRHPAPPPRAPGSAKTHSAAPQEFFGKNSYARKVPQFRPLQPPPAANRPNVRLFLPRPVGEGRSLPRTRSGGEGPSAPVPLRLPRPVGEGRGEGLPGNTPRFSTVASAHPPSPPGNRPAAPQEFLGRNSYARKDTQFHLPRPTTT